MRGLDELVNDEDPAWPLVQHWFKEARNPVEVLPASRTEGEQALLAMQVTTRSPMGAILLETGGILVDGGWLRILGAGGERMSRSMPTWNEEAAALLSNPSEGLCLVADDVLGGLFALNGGAIDAEPGTVLYFAPDSLDWEDLEFGYSDFLVWAFRGDLDAFWGTQRWTSWRDDLSGMSGDRAISVYPPLCTEGGLGIDARSRREVSLAEVVGAHFSIREQLG